MAPSPLRFRANRMYTVCKSKGPVRKNTIGSEVAAPTVKRGFVMPEFFWGWCVCIAFMVSGQMGLPARMAARLNPCS